MTLQELAVAYFYARRAATSVAVCLDDLDAKPAAFMRRKGFDFRKLDGAADAFRAEYLFPRFAAIGWDEDKARKWLFKLTDKPDPFDMIKELPDDA